MGSKPGEIPAIPKSVMVPNPAINGGGQARPKMSKSVSISDSLFSNDTDISEIGNGHHHNGHPFHHYPKKNTRLRRCRKRLATLLHTHVALILVCTMAALDASFVIGQIIADILIMKETLTEWEDLDSNLTSVLVQHLPYLNQSGVPPDDLTLEKIRNFLLTYNGTSAHSPYGEILHDSRRAPSGHNSLPAGSIDPKLWQLLHTAAVNVPNVQGSGTFNVTVPGTPGTEENNSSEVVIGFFRFPLSRKKRRVAHSRAASSGENVEGHDVLHGLTHSFHLGSLIILSMLLAETLMKVFAMGKKVLHHKLEIFDAFVVSVSWALDVAFYEGIWAHPGTEAATILIIVLPWRVVRIVNSFVLVIQEKDHVQLKIVKQRLRLSVKKSKESTRKASSYRTEVKQLQGLCRKYGATENEINACGPTGRTGRRRSSLMPAMERVASLTLISALGSHPSLYTMDSSSDEEGGSREPVSRTVSADPTLRSAVSVSTLDSVFTIEGKGDFDSEFSDRHSTDGVEDSAVFQTGADDDSLHSTLNASTLARHSRSSTDSRTQLSRRLHARLVQQDSNASAVSEASTSCSSQGAGDPGAQDIPPHYHEVVAKQDSNTRL